MSDTKLVCLGKPLPVASVNVPTAAEDDDYRAEHMIQLASSPRTGQFPVRTIISPHSNGAPRAIPIHRNFADFGEG